MIHPRIRFTFALGIALTNVVVAIAQESNPTSGAKNTSSAIEALDQLIEQNRRLEKQNQQIEMQNQQLEKQNQQLMDEIKVLRGAMAQGTNVSDQTADAASAQAAADEKVQRSGQFSSPNQSKGDDKSERANISAQVTKSATAQTAAGGKVSQTKQSQNQSNGDDKTQFPEGSAGNDAIFGEFNPGRGFTVGKGKYGELNLSGYMVTRYLNQLPGDQSATDHLGRPIPVSPRQDFQFHRVMLFSQGWLFSPKFLYSTFLWTVQDTNQVAVGGALYYKFGKYLTLGGGWNAYPGTQSLQGSHPYWESYDRVMADEFFRPYFSQGVFAEGNLLPRLQYRWLIGNNLSNLDVPAVKLSRNLSGGGALTWLPTTGEFGPRGAFGDYEDHQNLATRFNLAYTYSPEDRQTPIGTPPSNTTLRLADSLNVFDTGALANGVTVERVRYQMVSAAAGMKYHGFWLQGEGYGRRLDDFAADGKLPVSVVRNSGFYVQLADMIVPKRFELYGATSFVFGDFGHPKEFLGGSNYYPWNTRNIRLNTQLIYVFGSPVNSTFGFYLGQLTGPIFSIGMTAFY